MEPSAWIALAALGVVIVVHAVATAFIAGKLMQRVSSLERDNDAIGKMGRDMSAMGADVRHLTGSVDELKGKLAWMTETASYPGQRRRGAPKGGQQ